MNGIVVDGVSKSYRRLLAGDRVRALDGVSLTIAPGEAFGVIGPNGAGKTTLFGCLLGFLRLDAGRISIDGRDADDLANRAVTGYLPERLVMDRWMTGRDFLAYHHGLARLPAASRGRDVEEALQRVGLDADAGGRAIRKYSRGMLQRIGLAQAMLGAPRYVFLDEPASGVDPAGVILFRRLLGELKAAGVTVVLNSHHLDQVERLCDRVAFVSKGHVEAIETMTAGAAVARTLVVRWPAGTSPTREALATVAAQAHVELAAVSANEARFVVAGDDASARLVASLVGAGIAIAEARAEEGRLERLFLESGAAATGDPSS